MTHIWASSLVLRYILSCHGVLGMPQSLWAPWSHESTGIYGFPIWAGSTTMRPSNNGSSAQLFAWDRKRASASLPTFHETCPGQEWLGKCPILGLKLTPFCWPKLIADKKKLFAHLPHVFHIHCPPRFYCITKSLVSLFIPAKWIPIGIYKIVSSLYDHYMSNISPYYHYISLYLSLYNIHQYILNTYIYKIHILIIYIYNHYI
jgi:hypothetical protein